MDPKEPNKIEIAEDPDEAFAEVPEIPLEDDLSEIPDAEIPQGIKEYTKEQEEQADTQFEFTQEEEEGEKNERASFEEELAEVQVLEEEALASVEAPPEKKEWVERTKKALMAITLAASLKFAAPALAEQPKGQHVDQPQRVEQVQKESFGLSSESLDAQEIEQPAQKSEQEEQREYYEQMRMEALKRTTREALQAIQENVSDKGMQEEARALVKTWADMFIATGDMAWTVIHRAGMPSPKEIKLLIGERKSDLLDSIEFLRDSIVAEGKSFDLRNFLEREGIQGFNPQADFEQHRKAEEVFWTLKLHVNMKEYQEHSSEPMQPEQ